ncbi:hypothetical protein X797_010525 [Metarhizium robertsii]|uniref:Uncharacterized protein n=1 Tax=Metarhizium robertsii TaxID=568076 RepID=A0A014N8S8_9HYPO|nr:hypothetical protein X797_010525 [Metarhizium robertsii]
MKAMTIALLYLGGRYQTGDLLAYYAPNCVKALDAALGLQCSCPNYPSITDGCCDYVGGTKAGAKGSAQRRVSTHAYCHNRAEQGSVYYLPNITPSC